jgi:hypothetical protein
MATAAPRRSSTTLDYSLRLLRWFDLHLKGDGALGAR